MSKYQSGSWVFDVYVSIFSPKSQSRASISLSLSLSLPLSLSLFYFLKLKARIKGSGVFGTMVRV